MTATLRKPKALKTSSAKQSQENVALLADKERMDWLQKNEWYWNSKRRDLRKAIDRARKEQP